MPPLDIVVVNRCADAAAWAARACLFPAAMIRSGAAGVERRWRHGAAPHATGKREREPNREQGDMGRTIRATGWLRASGFGSSTATFDIELGATGACGHVRAEMAMIIEAMAAGRAFLVTESGRWIAIRPTERTAEGLAFTVLDDPATVARHFS